MNDFDLQIQSSVSDGKYSPRELVLRASRFGIKTIALTDHDTVDGVGEAVFAGENLGVEIITGIEISAHDEAGDMHILGLGLDCKNPDLLQELKKSQQARVERGKEMVRRLSNMGFKVTYEDVLRYAKGSTVGRPHISQAVLANPENKKLLEEVSDIGGFIRAFLVPGKEAYVIHDNISVKNSVGLIHQAHGVAIWSHPALQFEDFGKLEAALNKFLGFGVDGVEVFNPAHTESQTRFLYTLAIKLKIMFTGGSDFHTEETSDDKGAGGRELGSFPTYGFDVSGVVSKLKEAIARRRE